MANGAESPFSASYEIKRRRYGLDRGNQTWFLSDGAGSRYQNILDPVDYTIAEWSQQERLFAIEVQTICQADIRLTTLNLLADRQRANNWGRYL